MAAIEKTVDIIGDDAFCALILGRSIPDGMPVDFYDDILTKLRPHALRNMSGLESVYFPNVTYLGKYALAECPDLKRVDLPKVTSHREGRLLLPLAFRGQLSYGSFHWGICNHRRIN